MKIVLASASPRRKEILSPYFPSLEVIPAHIDETQFYHLPPKEMVIRLAESKADAIFNSVSSDLIIASDTIVELDNELLEKPSDADDARRMLSTLSGKKHNVCTAVALFSDTKKISFCHCSHVHFHELNSALIERYIATSLPFDKAGAYGIQDTWASLFIKEIRGSFYSVMGFPIEEFHQVILKEFPEIARFMYDNATDAKTE